MHVCPHSLHVEAVITEREGMSRSSISLESDGCNQLLSKLSASRQEGWDLG